jgi:hypothetical protein
MHILCSGLTVLAPELTSSTFVVGLTDNDPVNTAPSSDNYALYGQMIDGLALNGSTVTLSFNQQGPPSRYLIVQKPTAGRLTICELEVYSQGLVDD